MYIPSLRFSTFGWSFRLIVQSASVMEAAARTDGGYLRKVSSSNMMSEKYSARKQVFSFRLHFCKHVVQLRFFLKSYTFDELKQISPGQTVALVLILFNI